MAEYDKIAKKYLESVSVKRTDMYDPAFISVLGNIKGKTILDLACGDGYYTRLMKNLGAKELLGVDVSSEMIHLAKEKPENKGIKFLLGDAITLEKIGDFDIVTGTLLLHYSKTKEELLSMCKNIYKNLKKGGRFVGLNNNPFHPLQPWEKYGVIVKAVKNKPLEDGDQIKIIFLKDGEESVSFINYYWSEKTYRQILSEAGFKNINFYDAKVSENKLKEDKRDFWREYLKEPGIAVIECFK